MLSNLTTSKCFFCKFDTFPSFLNSIFLAQGGLLGEMLSKIASSSFIKKILGVSYLKTLLKKPTLHLEQIVEGSKRKVKKGCHQGKHSHSSYLPFSVKTCLGQ